MKNLFLVILCLFTSILYAQKSEIQQIKSNFHSQFPDAQEVEFEVEDDYVEVEFEKNGYEMEAIYNLKGELVQTYVEVAGAELPLVVYEAIARDYAGYDLDDVEREESNGVIVYTIELENDDEEWELVYDALGNLMTKEREDGF